MLMPTVVFAIVMASMFLFQRLGKKMDTAFEDTKLSTRDTIIMVIMMGLMVTIIAFVPGQAVGTFFVAAYSYMLFMFVYITLKKWYLALLPPLLFVTLYFFYWNTLILNLFAAVFAVIVTIYMGTLFSWKTTLVFAVLLTVMDIIQVSGTGLMQDAATKMIELKLPIAVILPTYPAGGWMGLGLGDIFFAGLLSIQTAMKHGRKAGILSAAAIGVAMFIFELITYNFISFDFFPATVIVIAGWAASIGITRIANLKPKPEAPQKEEPTEQEPKSSQTC